MEQLAIANKHAAIKGMPKLSQEDARKVTAAILAMRVSTRESKSRHTRKATSNFTDAH